MALTPFLADQAANAAADAVCALLDGGSLRIYDGTQPATANTAVGSQVKLAELAFDTPAFDPAVAGVATANAITSANALATGTATWFRAVTSGGATVFDGSVGTSGANLNLNIVAIVSGSSVGIAGFTYTQRES
jgi:hypothetical protein